jgi:flagellar basal body-associated protein FliL
MEEILDIYNEIKSKLIASNDKKIRTVTLVSKILLGHDKKIILELYNAIFDTNYGDDAQIEITTLDDVLFMDWINDISFVINGKLVVLIEHQSTINGNMPLRMLLYMARTYEKICNKENIYGSKMLEIPRPEFVVLYNGEDKIPDRTELSLSDMFAKHGEDNPINLELKVQVYNINEGHNPQFAQKSATLKEYEIFIAKIRENEKTMQREEAIVSAIKYCENKGVLKEFLKEHSSEVRNMLLTEFNLKDAQEVWKREGIEEGIIEVATKMIAKGMDINTIAEVTGLLAYDILRLKPTQNLEVNETSAKYTP